MSKPALLLFPNLLGEHKHHQIFLPASVDKAVASIDGLIAESDKGGRRFLSRFEHEKNVRDIPIALLNEHHKDLDFLLEPIIDDGQRWGVVSDAGNPCMADPGAQLVFRAREKGVNIQGFVGPSAITLGLMLSGLPAQRFCFHGYLSRDQKERDRQVRALDKRSKADGGATQLCIEAPYRNKWLYQSMLENLSDNTLFAIAWDLTLPTQGIVVQKISAWKKFPMPNIEKKPAIFLLCNS
jgi:16S rRNA (cytidine1402-2'-O)-methyltransferase